MVENRELILPLFCSIQRRKGHHLNFNSFNFVTHANDFHGDPKGLSGAVICASHHRINGEEYQFTKPES